MHLNDTIFFFIVFLSLLFISMIIDYIYGEIPSKIHPVVICGNLISFLTNVFIKIRNKFSGLLLTTTTLLILIFSFTFLFFILLKINFILFILISAIFLSTTFSIKLLLNSALDIKNQLNKDINEARKSVSYLVSRSTDELSEKYIISATIETLSENITDSFISPIFYYFILGIIFLILINKNIYYNEFFIFLIIIPFIYRIINTLDAMVGYKNQKYANIGYFSAILDDFLNWIPSRLSGLILVISSYILNLNWINAFKMYKRDSNNCESPNSGYTMATIAGALDIQLVKKGSYKMGDENKNLEIDDIEKAVNVSKLTIILYTLITSVIFITIFLLL